MMTLRRLAVLTARREAAPPGPLRTSAQVELGVALARRRSERGTSKLARRLSRKRARGASGSF